MYSDYHRLESQRRECNSVFMLENALSYWNINAPVCGFVMCVLAGNCTGN